MPKKKDYVSPICVSKEATDVNYDAAVQYMLEHLDTMSIFAGTHNELSSYKLMEMMHKKELLKMITESGLGNCTE